MKKGDIYYIDEYKEVWKLTEEKSFEDGKIYFNFKVLHGKNRGSEITHYHKSEGEPGILLDSLTLNHE